MEVISLQCGFYANHVGAHSWNLQESLFEYKPLHRSKSEIAFNHDIFFRVGKTLGGEETYLPRLVLFDDHSNFNFKSNLYNDCEPDYILPWKGELVTVKQEHASHSNEFVQDLSKEADHSVSENGDDARDMKMEDDGIESDPRSKVYDLTNSCQSWCDYSRVFLHPRSLILTSGLDSCTMFKSQFSQKHSSEFEDRLCYFAEECDHLQGFNLSSSMYETSSVNCSIGLLDMLADDYRKKAILAVPLFEPKSILKPLDHLNSLWMTSSLCESPTDCFSVPVTCPLQVKGFDFDVSSPYLTSAIIALALNTLTTPLRTKENQLSLHSYGDLLTLGSRKFSTLSMTRDSQKYNDSMFTSLAPFTLYDTKITASQLLVARGFDIQQNPNSLETHLQFSYNSPLKLESPFPHIEECNKAKLTGRRMLPCGIVLQNSVNIVAMLNTVVDNCQKLKRSFLNRVEGYDKDSFNEMCEIVLTHADNYC